jgi:hypothetical protein
MDILFKLVTPNEENGLTGTDELRFKCSVCSRDVLGSKLQPHAHGHAYMNGDSDIGVIVDSRAERDPLADP